MSHVSLPDSLDSFLPRDTLRDQWNTTLNNIQLPNTQQSGDDMITGEGPVISTSMVTRTSPVPSQSDYVTTSTGDQNVSLNEHHSTSEGSHDDSEEFVAPEETPINTNENSTGRPTQIDRDVSTSRHERASIAPPTRTHGNLLKYTTLKIPSSIVCVTSCSPHPAKYTAISIVNGAVKVGYLQQNRVCVHDLDLNAETPLSSQFYGFREKEASLNVQGMVLAGKYLAVWGFHTRKWVSHSRNSTLFQSSGKLSLSKVYYLDLPSRHYNR
jgi:hypothetical protein